METYIETDNLVPMKFERYTEQIAHWPDEGRHILAQFDANSIVVYQAYNAAISQFVVKNGFFGGEFSFDRMSWIKPNFLWMMYRSGWAQKRNQENILALRIRRAFFEELLECAVESSFRNSTISKEEEWKAALQASRVRLQWDPDHDPSGKSVLRRALQLGLRGDILRRFGTDELLEVVDLTDFVKTQFLELESTGDSEIVTPMERCFVPSSSVAIENIRL